MINALYLIRPLPLVLKQEQGNIYKTHTSITKSEKMTSVHFSSSYQNYFFRNNRTIIWCIFASSIQQFECSEI